MSAGFGLGEIHAGPAGDQSPAPRTAASHISCTTAAVNLRQRLHAASRTHRPTGRTAIRTALSSGDENSSAHRRGSGMPRPLMPFPWRHSADATAAGDAPRQKAGMGLHTRARPACRAEPLSRLHQPLARSPALECRVHAACVMPAAAGTGARENERAALPRAAVSAPLLSSVPHTVGAGLRQAPNGRACKWARASAARRSKAHRGTHKGLGLSLNAPRPLGSPPAATVPKKQRARRSGAPLEGMAGASAHRAGAAGRTATLLMTFSALCDQPQRTDRTITR